LTLFRKATGMPRCRSTPCGATCPEDA